MADDMTYASVCPRCGVLVLGDAKWCAQCGLVRGAAGLSAQPRKPWMRADKIAIVVWAATTIGATSLWWHWVIAQTPPNTELDWGKAIGVVIAPLLVSTLGLGVIAGALIHSDGPKVELLVLACAGAACMVFTVSGIASNDPTQCDPNSSCDLSYGLGAMLEFPLVFVPFLAGTAMGRGVSVLLRRREV